MEPPPRLCVDCDEPATHYGLYCPEHIPKWDPVANCNLTKQTDARTDEQEDT